MSLATFGNGQGGVSLGGIRYRSASYNFPETSSSNKCTARYQRFKTTSERDVKVTWFLVVSSMINTKEHSKEICYVKVGKLKERKKCLDNRVRIVKGENVENTTTQWVKKCTKHNNSMNQWIIVVAEAIYTGFFKRDSVVKIEWGTMFFTLALERRILFSSRH